MSCHKFYIGKQRQSKYRYRFLKVIRCVFIRGSVVCLRMISYDSCLRLVVYKIIFHWIFAKFKLDVRGLKWRRIRTRMCRRSSITVHSINSLRMSMSSPLSPSLLNFHKWGFNVCQIIYMTKMKLYSLWRSLPSVKKIW